MYHKIITMLFGLLTAAALLSGCGKLTENTSDTVKETDTTDSITSSISTEESAPIIEIGVSGGVLPFPFKYEELENLINLSDCQNVYFEEKGFSVCNVYQGMNRICTLFVTGDVSEHTSDTLVTQISIEDTENGIFTLNGLKDDKLEDFKAIFGESETKSDTLYDHTWGNIILCVLFDHETGKAKDIQLLDTDYPYSL
ncbi:MAG: hypothetical protein K2N72_11945 [Oscillospiraceae bacterium]|nr:hypothetical protein [Oscillospiraceae bacterium]